MAPKRRFGEEEEEDDGFRHHNQETKRRIVASNFVQNATCGLSTQDLVSTLEPLIRKWVRDEVQGSFQSFFCTLPRSPIKALEPCRKTSLQLRFQAKLPNTFFTGSKIESEDNTSVKLLLFDVNSNRIVSSGPFSSLKVEIVPLDGDFSADDEEDWGEKDFEAKVISARDGRRPLITGDLVVNLKNGVGDLGELCFTDNSSWRRSRKFMIGARVKDTCSIGARIREARSQAFIVKDHRGESYKKHHPPSLEDEVWRLEKIAKDGVFHKRLESQRISTVKDFLQLYVTNQSLLRKLLGGSSNKTWETIIKHAKDCVLDENLYIYRCDANGIGLVFDSVFKVVGAIFDDQTYLPLDKLSVLQMPVVEALKQQVYKNLCEMLPTDAESIFGVPVVMSNLNHDPLTNSSLSLQGVNIPISPDEVEMHMYGVMENSSEVEVNVGNEPFSMGFFSPELRNSFFFKEFSNGIGYGQDVDFESGTSLWHGHDVFVDTSNQTVDIVSSDFGICYSGNGSPRARWCKIRAALKWDSVRRDVAAKKTAETHSYLDFLV